jgi:hypothetical protein
LEKETYMSKNEKKSMRSGGGPIFNGDVYNTGNISGRSDHYNKIKDLASELESNSQESKKPIIAGPSRESSGQIFISYRRSDSIDITGRIYDRLVTKFGKGPIFKDVDSIPLGIDFKESLQEKVSACNIVLAIIGREWADAKDAKGNKRLADPTDFVRIEIESALDRGIPVIPLLVQGAQMPVEVGLPAGLRRLVYRNGIQIRPDPDFHHDMDRLITALENTLNKSSASDRPR